MPARGPRVCRTRFRLPNQPRPASAPPPDPEGCPNKGERLKWGALYIWPRPPSSKALRPDAVTGGLRGKGQLGRLGQRSPGTGWRPLPVPHVCPGNPKRGQMAWPCRSLRMAAYGGGTPGSRRRGSGAGSGLDVGRSLEPILPPPLNTRASNGAPFPPARSLLSSQHMFPDLMKTPRQ